MRSVLSGRWKPCCLAAAPIGRIAAAPSAIRRATSSHVRRSIKLRSLSVPMRRAFLFLEHDLFGKPVSTFPDHALTAGGNACQTSRTDPAVQIARTARRCTIGIIKSRQHLAEYAERNSVRGLVPHHRL